MDGVVTMGCCRGRRCRRRRALGGGHDRRSVAAYCRRRVVDGGNLSMGLETLISVLSA
jgi:hypothetical protein